MSSRASTPSPAPDWTLVPFDVPCARCGGNLHGLEEPTCPSCGFGFDWARAVPLEALTCSTCGYRLCGLTTERCPECGKSFSWDEVLTEHHRRQDGLFEYRWRETPFRSFFGTIRRVCRPAKFWSNLDPHAPPQPKPLLAMATVALVLYVIYTPLMHLATDASTDLFRDLSYWRSGGPLRLNRYFDLDYWYWTLSWTLPSDRVTAWVLFGLCWCVTSLFALLLFQQSMRRCRVRIGQVLRVWVYAVVIPLMLAPAVLLSALALTGLAALCTGQWWPYETVPFHLPLYAGLVWSSMLLAYHRYLRMRRGVPLVVLSQVMAFLMAALLSAAILGDRFWLGLGNLMRAYIDILR